MKKVIGFTLLALVVSVVPARAEDKNIVEIAVANKDFSTLVAAVKAAGLVDTLAGEGPFTVFAPTNEAFAKLGDEKIAALLKDKEALTKILLAHVVKGKVMAKTALTLDGKMAETAGGAKVAVKLNGEKLTVGGATVIKTDIEAKNGVIHVIDTVIIPD